ncbi:MAG TPA: SUMF1/EgtB/PvdO family nonheme iron enzyme [Xanthobacteraceae bacterium]|nr:SUMF1/EgtB/PvdO family nonheme iron enzyme [Xanthobacteraceae bacterium]
MGLNRTGLDPRYFAWPPENQPDRGPYPGLRPLEAEDAGIFFGREAPTVVVLDRLRGLREAAAPRLLIILGASGSGKSSFLRAGLIPRLSRDEVNFFPLPILRPEMGVITGKTGLIHSVQEALAANGLSLNRADIAEKVSEGAAALLPLLNELARKARAPTFPGGAPPAPPSLVLSIDQGEELFLAEGTEEVHTFLVLLKHLVHARTLNLIVLCTIRSDSYERLQTALEGIRAEIFGLPAMPRGAYQTIIEGPAKKLKDGKRKLEIEPALTEAMLTDIEADGGKDALPLLAFTLERLYREYGADGDLLVKEYDALGRIRGSIEAGVEAALTAANADPTVPKDAAARRGLLRRVMIPALARIDLETGKPRRRAARMSEIPAEARGLVNCLVEARLLVTDSAPGTGETVIEPAHEALLRQWGALQEWLKEDSEALLMLGGLQQAAAEWERQEGKEEYLWPQKRVLQACVMVDRLRPQLNQTEKRFLLLLDSNDLLQELTSLSTPHQRRAAIGDRLAKIGDNRAGVGLCPDGTPDLLWCEIPSAEISLGDGAGTFSVKPFRMAKYPVTWAQYRSFLAAPDGYANSAWWERLVRNELPEDTERAANLPAENASWYDAVAFCRWLSARLGFEVRLPAEWEWEAAATGGCATYQYPWGMGWDSRYANTEDSGINRSTAVGMYPHGASPFGILDLSGNVWEWCINEYESSGAVEHAGGRARAVRGGSWMWKHDCARVTLRERDLPDYRSRNHGFRLACSIR